MVDHQFLCHPVFGTGAQSKNASKVWKPNMLGFGGYLIMKFGNCQKYQKKSAHENELILINIGIFIDFNKYKKFIIR